MHYKSTAMAKCSNDTALSRSISWLLTHLVSQIWISSQTDPIIEDLSHRSRPRRFTTIRQELLDP